MSSFICDCSDEIQFHQAFNNSNCGRLYNLFISTRGASANLPNYFKSEQHIDLKRKTLAKFCAANSVRFGFNEILFKMRSCPITPEDAQVIFATRKVSKISLSLLIAWHISVKHIQYNSCMI